MKDRAATIFLTLAGSQAHGTAREGSDVDIRGVSVQSLHDRLSLFSTFEQYEGALPFHLEESIRPRLEAHPTAGRAYDLRNEVVVFELAKFLRLCTEANPNALEILFADPRDWLLETSAWKQLHAHRHLFLTQRVQHTFLGYAMAQLRRIRSHRSWLLHPPAQRPQRADFGLTDQASALTHEDRNRYEQRIAEVTRSWEVDDIEMSPATRIAVRERHRNFQDEVLRLVTERQIDESPGTPGLQDPVAAEEAMRTVAASALRIPKDVFASLNAERRYRDAVRHWDAYQTWLRERNPARAELERTHGYDTKHAMHLIRLMRMGVEALATGELRVRRPDAAELLTIRDGALTYDELEPMATELQRSMQEGARKSQLPTDVDRTQVDALFRSMAIDLSR